MSHEKLRAAAQALADKLPKPGSPAYPHYHAQPELEALRAELAKPAKQPNLIALVVKDFDRAELHGGAAS